MTSPSGVVADATVVPDDVVAALRAAQHVALVGHVTPDADALASMGALWLALPELGKHGHMIVPPGSVSRKLEYLFEFSGLLPEPPQKLLDCDLIVALDTAKEKRLSTGDVDALATNIPLVNIDHHATNTGFGQVQWIVGHSSSTSELTYAVLQALGVTITPTIATLLYAGIHTDTQGFSLANTGANALAVGEALARAGADIPAICERMHRSHSRGEFQLLSIVYGNTKVSDDGRLAWSTASYDEIATTGCTASDIDDQVEVPRSVAGISAAILFSEAKRGKVRMNFRGEQGLSILPLAQEFGGGGHNAAAGAILDGTIEEITARVLPAALRFVAEHGVKSAE